MSIENGSNPKSVANNTQKEGEITSVGKKSDKLKDILGELGIKDKTKEVLMKGVEEKKSAQEEVEKKEAEERERQKLEKTIKEKQREYEERMQSVIFKKARLAGIKTELAQCDEMIEQTMLAIERLTAETYFKSEASELLREINARLKQVENEHRQISSQKPSRKLFGLREDGASKEKLEKETSSLVTLVDNLKHAEKLLSEALSDGRTMNITSEKFINFLQQEVGYLSKYESYKYQRDRLSELVGKLKDRRVDKTEKDLLAKKEVQEKKKKEIGYDREEVEGYINYSEKEDLPKLQQEIERLRQEVANK